LIEKVVLHYRYLGEGELVRIGKTPDDLCRKADINRSTWTRWKAGTVIPNLATWQRVREALSTLTPNANEAAE